MAFAVVDFETTGILPSYHHRVVEVGVTHVDDDGTVTARWETLVNPERDLGPQHIHGIRAADILDAPTFGDIAAELADLLRGRVFAAHNAAFDLRFLRAEFERAGYRLQGDVPSVCTMALGSHFGLGASASLAHACATHQITHDQAHSAGSDSYAAAELLSTYRRESSTWEGWDGFWEAHAHAGRAYVYPAVRSRGVVAKPRVEAQAAPPSFLEKISTDAVREAVEGADAEYLALLDRCLLDGHISAHEAAQLADVARELGLDRARVTQLHVGYYRALGRRAWADGILTPTERADLAAVADLLHIPDDVRAEVTEPQSPTPDQTESAAAREEFTLATGAIVVLTGEMSRPRSAWEAELIERGLIPHPSVTKKASLVVAADPDSLSGKAKKARDYGIPIVNENGLRKLLDASQLERNDT